MQLLNTYKTCMVKKVLSISTCFFVLLNTYCRASDETIFLDSANAAYLKGHYAESIQYYEKIISLGYESAEVYFNLGNAYYKTNEIGLSILNYERAKKLNPKDEDINFNLQLTNQRTVDKIEPEPKLFLDEWWVGIKNMHSEKTWSIRSMVFFILSFIFLGIFLTTGNKTSKLFSFWLTITFILLSSATFIIAKSKYNEMINHKTAIILSSSTEVRNIPSEGGVKLFILHEGAKIYAPEINGDWVKIELTPEKVGWVKRASVELI